MPEKGAEETTNGSYEPVKYHVFDAVDYQRLISWEPCKGTLVLDGKYHQTSQKTVDKLLDEGTSLVVMDQTWFRLVKK